MSGDCDWNENLRVGFWYPSVEASKFHVSSSLKKKIYRAREECKSCNREEGIENLSTRFNDWIR